MRKGMLLCALTALYLVACGGDSETTAGSGTSQTTASSTTEGATTASGGTGGSSGTGGSTGEGGNAGGAGPGADQIVINEIMAVGWDWLELVNKSDKDFDLTDYGVTDTDKMGGPKFSGVLRFPGGTSIPAKGYLVVAGDQGNASSDMDPCLNAAAGTCFHATWNVSASNGETLYFVAPNNMEIATAEYPINAVLDTQTWCRMPDMTGDFAACSATLGKMNAP